MKYVLLSLLMINSLFGSRLFAQFRNKTAIITCELTTENVKLIRTFTFNSPNVVLVDTDSLGVFVRTFSDNKWSGDDLLLKDSLVVDYIFNAFYTNDFENIKKIRLGSDYKLRRIKGSLYRIEFDFKGYYYDGEVQCIENVAVDIRVTKYKRDNKVLQVLEHENVLISKIRFH